MWKEFWKRWNSWGYFSRLTIRLAIAGIFLGILGTIASILGFINSNTALHPLTTTTIPTLTVPANTPTITPSQYPASSNDLNVTPGLPQPLDTVRTFTIQDNYKFGKSFLAASFPEIQLPNNELAFAISFESGPIGIFQAKDFAPLSISEELNMSIRQIIFSEDARYLFTGSDAGEFTVWLIDNKELIKRRTHLFPASVSAISVSGNAVAVGLNNVPGSELEQSFIKFPNPAANAMKEEYPQIDSFQSNINGLVFNGTTVVSVGSSAYIRWYSLNRNDNRFDQRGYAVLANSGYSKAVDIFVSHEGEFALVADDRGKVHLLNLDSKLFIESSSSVGSVVSTISYIPRLHQFAVGTEDCYVFLISAENLEILVSSDYLCSNGHSKIISLDPSADGTLLLATTSQAITLLNLTQE